jgi:formate hydrogenlyase subunit 4
MVWAERKIAARFQDRIGPNRVGPLGLLQPIADALKLITKESIVPRAADQWVHLLAPVLMLVSAFLVLAVIPFGVGLAPVNLPSGLLYLVAVASMSTLGVFLAGWSSRNKYSLLGALSAGPNLVVLTTEGDLIVARRTPEKFDELHRYKVADSQTWAQPVLLKNGVVIRNADAVTFWSF